VELSNYYSKVGVIGLGAVGRQVCQAIDSGQVEAELAAVFDSREERVQRLLADLKRITRSMTIVGLVTSADLVVECTTPEAAADMVMASLNGGKDVLVTNPGALLGQDTIFRLATERNIHIFLPTLQLAGMDGLRVAAQGRVDSCLVTVSVPGRMLARSPLLAGKAPKDREVVFQGPVAQAARGVPALANPLAVVSFGGVGPLRTVVRIVCDERVEQTVFQVEVAGECGRMVAWMDTHPDPLSPERSRMVALSAISALKNIFNPVRLI